MRLLEPRPARVTFVCDCRATLSFSTFDRPGDCKEIRCPECGRIWEQRLVLEEGDRGWTRILLKGPLPKALAPSASARS